LSETKSSNEKRKENLAVVAVLVRALHQNLLPFRKRGMGVREAAAGVPAPRQGYREWSGKGVVEWNASKKRSDLRSCGVDVGGAAGKEREVHVAERFVRPIAHRPDRLDRAHDLTRWSKTENAKSGKF